jgi:hypothetical protein
MKASLLFVFAASLLAAGCGDDKSSTTAGGSNAASSSVSPAGAPAGYLGAITKGEQNAVKTVDTTSLNQAIQLFNVDKGRFPKDLNELVTEKYMPQIPTPPYGTKLDYDANAGRVTVVKQ